MRSSKWLCAVSVAVLALSSPLMTWEAMAQSAQYQYETREGGVETSTGDKVGAFFLNTVFIPGRVITCTLGTLASSTLLLLTYGSANKAAVNVFKEGCGGTWVLTGDNVSGKTPVKTYVD